jgi:hypothetical protein
MRALFIILLIFTLNSCGSLVGSNLINSFLTPSTFITAVADIGIEQETGKKISEHALSLVTSKDCKFNLQNMTICKDENIANKNITLAKYNKKSSKKTKVASLSS